MQEIAQTYGPGMDPMVELLMQTFIKLAAATKKDQLPARQRDR